MSGIQLKLKLKLKKRPPGKWDQTDKSVWGQGAILEPSDYTVFFLECVKLILGWDPGRSELMKGKSKGGEKECIEHNRKE